MSDLNATNEEILAACEQMRLNPDGGAMLSYRGESPLAIARVEKDRAFAHWFGTGRIGEGLASYSGWLAPNLLTLTPTGEAWLRERRAKEATIKDTIDELDRIGSPNWMEWTECGLPGTLLCEVMQTGEGETARTHFRCTEIDERLRGKARWSSESSPGLFVASNGWAVGSWNRPAIGEGNRVWARGKNHKHDSEEDEDDGHHAAAIFTAINEAAQAWAGELAAIDSIATNSRPTLEQRIDSLERRLDAMVKGGAGDE